MAQHSGHPTNQTSQAAATLTERLADFLVSWRPQPLPAPVLAESKRYVLDWLASALGGTAAPPGRMLLQYGSSLGNGSAQVIGLGARDTWAAALINGALSHILEMDDLDRGSVLHPAAPIIPAAWAALQSPAARYTTGPDLLAAIVLGYEVGIHIGEAAGRTHYHFWHTTATCGTFGAAVAAGWIMGLDRQQFVWALGNAGTQAAGLWQFNADGAMSKHLHAGKAAANGLLAAQLAALGFSGARAILEGTQGFFAATSRDARPEKVVEGLDSAAPQFKIGKVSFKPFPSCRHTHPAIDAALRLRARQSQELRAEDIAAVQVETYAAALSITDNPTPQEPYAAKFSLQYCVALALAKGQVALPDFTPHAIQDALVRQLMARVQLQVAADLDARYPQAWPVRLTVHLVSGQELREQVDTPLGDPEAPLDQATLEGKFNQLAQEYRDIQGRSLPVGMAANLVDRVNQLDRSGAVTDFLPG